MRFPAALVFCFLLGGFASSLSGQEPFSAVLTSVDSNTVAIAWPTEINGTYNLLATTGPDEPWQPVFAEPLFAPLNRLTIQQPVDASTRQFRVSRFDTVPPVAWAVAPAPGAVGVSRRGHISISIYDDGTLDTNSISVVLTNGPPMTLANAPLRFENGVLIFEPGTNVLGTFGQLFNVEVRSSDLAGNAFTNTWTFKLEDAPVPDPDVIVVSNAPPGLVLIAVLDDAFTYQFTGDTSGLVPGNILVNEDPTFPYRRLVVFVHEEPTEHEVTVLTTNAPLSESLAGGSVQVGGELDSTPFIFTSLAPAFPFQAAAVPDCCSVTISNRLLASGPDVNALISGRVELQPALAARGVFQAAALAAMDFDFQGKVVAALELEAEGHTAGNFTNRLTLGSATNRFPPTYAGPVPASASVAVAFELVMESSWPKPGRVRIGMLETNLISLNAQLREQNWTTRGTRLRRFSLPPARSDDAPTAQVRLYLEEHVTLELERSPAIALTLRPGLEALALASAPPGMTGSDLTLHASLTATLAIQPSAWDVGAPSLPATNILSTRDFAQHLADFARIGPRLAVQPIPGMVWVAPGSFQMGDSPTNPPTQVTLTRGFYIGRREVAQAEYAAVLYTNESYFHGGQWGTNAARPIEWLSWHQATNYCARLTAAERQANHIPSSYGYRLPTEAEWEFAARAGTTNAFPTGDQLLPGWANFACGADPQSPCAVNPIFGVIPPELPRLNQTVAGGLFAPNRWGLHDTAGNVREWCLDWLGNSLPAGTLTDPQGTDTTLRAVRGGSFDLPSSACRFSSRQFSTSSAAAPDIGFRVVLAPAQVVSGLESYTNTLRPGLSIVANQLNHPVNNRITTLFTNRVFLSLSKLVPGTASFDTAVFDPDAGEWSDPTGMTLNPGEAVYVDNLSGAPVSVTFYGERVVNFTRPPLSGQHMLSNPLPEPGTYFAIVGSMPTGLVTVTRAREDGSSINYIYDPDAGGWSPEEPIADIGEGFVFDFH